MDVKRSQDPVVQLVASTRYVLYVLLNERLLGTTIPRTFTGDVILFEDEFLYITVDISCITREDLVSLKGSFLFCPTINFLVIVLQQNTDMVDM